MRRGWPLAHVLARAHEGSGRSVSKRVYKPRPRAVSGTLANLNSWLGAYNSTDPRRKILELFNVQKATSNQALGGNLPNLVNQCRHLERNCPSARAISEGWVADVVGTGIDVAPETGSTARDKNIRDAWLEWAEYAGVDGTSLWELQAQAMREVTVAGSFIWRFLVLPERAREGKIPLAIMPIEVEWLSSLPIAPIPDGCVFVNGVEMNRIGQPVAYHLMDPNFVGDITRGERVSAGLICHGFEKRRPFQALGEPILAPLVERLKQEEDLIKTELAAAQIASNFAVTIKSDYHDDATDEATDDPQSVTDISPGTVTRLLPGESAEAFQSSRPNQMIAPFREMLRGDLAAAGRVPVKWLNRDYSSATFMNTRMEQADSKRMHKATQNWLARHVASRPYLEVLPWILLSRGLVMPAEKTSAKKLLAHKVLPDLPEYVDPLKDGEAALQNINGNLSTLEHECSSRGKDWQKIAEQRAAEKKFLDGLGLTMPDPSAPKPGAAADPAAEAAKKKPTKKEAPTNE
jgi:lambda family phage portal protein